MDAVVFLLLAGAGFVGGAVNAVAGGGTFFTFPALMAAGLDPLTANVTNAVAIYPGHAAAVPAYRVELRRAGRKLVARSLVALSGGLLGASLLLWAGDPVFTAAVPWLLLTATLIFAAGPAVGALLERTGATATPVAALVEFLFAVYGGYFGAGLGVLLIAGLTIVGVRDIQMANAQKNLLATLVTTVSVAVFVTAGTVAWTHVLAVGIGAIVGGYWGARMARRLPVAVLRVAVIATGSVLSVYYFIV